MQGKLLANRYLLADELGNGGMGSVYLATDLRTGGKVAVKFPHPVLAHDREYRERLRREAEIAASLHSTRIVRVIDFDSDDGGVPFLVMEYVPGDTLATVLRARGRLSPREGLAIALEIARALDAAHQHNVVHRDLKPQNIKLQDGEVKVLDFGIAKNLSNLSAAASIILGTPEYSAPERLAGVSDIRSDIYSLGVILYELLAGHPPFTARRPMEVLRKHEEAPVPPLPSDVPEDAAVIVRRCLAKSPDERYQTPRELVAAIQPVLATLPDTAPAPTSATRPTIAPTDELAPAAGGTSTTARPSVLVPGTVELQQPVTPVPTPPPVAATGDGVAATSFPPPSSVPKTVVGPVRPGSGEQPPHSAARPTDEVTLAPPAGPGGWPSTPDRQTLPQPVARPPRRGRTPTIAVVVVVLVLLALAIGAFLVFRGDGSDESSRVVEAITTATATGAPQSPTAPGVLSTSQPAVLAATGTVRIPPTLVPTAESPSSPQPTPSLAATTTVTPVPTATPSPSTPTTRAIVVAMVPPERGATPDERAAIMALNEANRAQVVALRNTASGGLERFFSDEALKDNIDLIDSQLAPKGRFAIADLTKIDLVDVKLEGAEKATIDTVESLEYDEFRRGSGEIVAGAGYTAVRQWTYKMQRRDGRWRVSASEPVKTLSFSER